MPAPTGHQGQSGGQYLIGPEYGHEPRLANCGAPRPCRVGPPSRAQFRARLCCGPRSGGSNSSSSCARRLPTRQWIADAAVLPSCCWRQTGMPRDLRLRGGVFEQTRFNSTWCFDHNGHADLVTQKSKDMTWDIVEMILKFADLVAERYSRIAH